MNTTTSEVRFTRRRLRSSYLSVIVSIALVLFVLGIFGLLVLNARSIARQVKENFTLTLLLEDEASPVAVSQFQKSLAMAPYLKDLNFISKEEAAEELRKSLDEEFVQFLGYNPLSDALELHLKAPYVNQAQLESLQQKFAQDPVVQEVFYDQPLLEELNRNIRRASYLLIGGAVLLALIAITLINSSIRLAIYSRRFLIKTMQLVGATRGFIRRPFLLRSLWHGVLGALVAMVLLSGLIYLLSHQLPGYVAILRGYQIALIGVGLLLGGILISVGCTYFAMRRYLRLTTDQLYF